MHLVGYLNCFAILSYMSFECLIVSMDFICSRDIRIYTYDMHFNLLTEKHSIIVNIHNIKIKGNDLFIYLLFVEVDRKYCVMMLISHWQQFYRFNGSLEYWRCHCKLWLGFNQLFHSKKIIQNIWDHSTGVKLASLSMHFGSELLLVYIRMDNQLHYGWLFLEKNIFVHWLAITWN